jgi:predicted transcriptional regulator of viral defense system
MKKQYFDEESVFRFVWEHADHDGIWNGNDASIAAAFGVTENEAYTVLGELTDRNRLQRVGSETYIITAWRERDDRSEEELSDNSARVIVPTSSTNSV